MLSLGEFGSLLTIIGGMLIAFYTLTKFMLVQAQKDRQMDREERMKLTDAINKMANSSKLIADEQRKGNVEAAERNGHLGEQNIKLAELVQNTTDKILNAIYYVKEQHVGKQVVQQENVMRKDTRE